MKLASIFTALIFSFIMLVSCKKAKETTATITVLDTNGLPVGGASVTLRGQSSADSKKNADPALSKNSITPANGIISFNYTEIYKAGQAGVAVIDIYSYKLSGSDTLDCKTYIKLEPETDNTQTVVLKPKS